VTTSSTETIDYSRKWFVMTAVVAGVLLATIDGSIVNIALPTLIESLDTTFNVVQWVSLAYLLTIATLTLGMGRLGDLVGKRKLYAVGFAIFTIASALCGLAPNVEALIAFRVLQALGSVLISPGCRHPRRAFPPRERGKALGWIGTAVSLGIITGPVVGGVLISAFGWRPIFLVNIPVGIVGTWLAVKYVPHREPVPGQTFDIAGTALMSLSLFSLSLSLTLGQELGYDTPMILLGFAVFGDSSRFCWVELRAKSLMLELDCSPTRCCPSASFRAISCSCACQPRSSSCPSTWKGFSASILDSSASSSPRHWRWAWSHLLGEPLIGSASAG
jgi:MFS family permease